jgi:hypothetical protein
MKSRVVVKRRQIQYLKEYVSRVVAKDDYNIVEDKSRVVAMTITISWRLL